MKSFLFFCLGVSLTRRSFYFNHALDPNLEEEICYNYNEYANIQFQFLRANSDDLQIFKYLNTTFAY